MKKILIKILFCCFWLSSYGQFEPHLDLGVTMNSRLNMDNIGRAGGGEIWAVYPLVGIGSSYYFIKSNRLASRTGLDITMSLSRFKDFAYWSQNVGTNEWSIQGQLMTTALRSSFTYLYDLNIKKQIVALRGGFIYSRNWYESVKNVASSYTNFHPNEFGVTMSIGWKLGRKSQMPLIEITYSRLELMRFIIPDKFPDLEMLSINLKLSPYAFIK